MSDEKIIDLKQAKKELEQTREQLMNYENMSEETLTELVIGNNVEAITELRKAIETTTETVGVTIDLIKQNQERITQAINMAGKIESDLMEQGIFVGSYSLDDID